jgi:hypothetical protein
LTNTLLDYARLDAERQDTFEYFYHKYGHIIQKSVQDPSYCHIKFSPRK